MVYRKSAPGIQDTALIVKTLLSSLRILLVLTVLTGIAYPFVVSALARALFADAAGGSLVRTGARIHGSALLAQKTESPRYFWPRPSAADFATIPSGASNQGPTSGALKTAIIERRAKFGADAPADLLTASGSGLDPHLSPEAAKYQAARIAAARQLSMDKVHTLIDENTQRPQLGFLGEPRVNVLTLNRALDAAE
jgi:K+-transporting ATPase ATPase C chain